MSHARPKPIFVRAACGPIHALVGNGPGVPIAAQRVCYRLQIRRGIALAQGAEPDGRACDLDRCIFDVDMADAIPNLIVRIRKRHIRTIHRIGKIPQQLEMVAAQFVDQLAPEKPRRDHGVVPGFKDQGHAFLLGDLHGHGHQPHQLVPRAGRHNPLLGAVISKQDHLLPATHNPDQIHAQGFGEANAPPQAGHMVFKRRVFHVGLQHGQAGEIVPRDTGDRHIALSHQRLHARDLRGVVIAHLAIPNELEFGISQPAFRHDVQCAFQIPADAVCDYAEFHGDSFST